MTTNVLNRPEPATAENVEGALTPDFLNDLREGYAMSREDRALHNAVTNNPIDSLALNRDAVRGEDGHFSHRIKQEGVTDQKQSGRCWMFAGLNTLRPQVMREHRMESFEFSTAYLQFWDKMEKSNLYLESVIELRDADFLDRDWELVNRHAIEEGGWWNFLVGLVEKYGVVPLSAMPETKSSSETRTLNEILGRLLRRSAARIMELYADGADMAAMRAAASSSVIRSSARSRPMWGERLSFPSVIAPAPPVRPFSSRTRTESVPASVRATNIPAGPAPTTATSQVFSAAIAGFLEPRAAGEPER